MQYALIMAVSLHVLASVFWAGTTFTLARAGGCSGRLLFRPQMVAATIAVLSGAFLWRVVHEGAFGPVERSLSVGALCALAAFLIQAIAVGMTLRKSPLLEDGGTTTSPSIVIAYRVAAALLAVAAVAMAVARYA